MRVTLERAALLKSLNHVHRVVERRTTIAILSNILLKAGGDALNLKATDLDIDHMVPLGQAWASGAKSWRLLVMVARLSECH